MGKIITIEYIRKYSEKENYKLLSNVYINSKTKLKWECPKGHIYKTIWNKFQQGHRCPICGGSQKLTFEFVKEQIENQGYKLLSTEYINVHSKLELKCPIGHIYWTRFSDFRQGSRCSICFGTHKLEYEFVKEQFKNENIELLSKEYTNNSTKLEVKCPKNHIYWVSYSNFKQGKRCPICDYEKTSSKPEIEIQKYVKKIHPSMIENDRTQILNQKTGKYLELDIWIPKLMKAIEYNGEYWHNKPKTKIKDKIKIEECKKLGIDLLIINEQDFINNKEVEMEKIKQFIKEGI